MAERLCLKVSTVRDIEDDKAPADLASTFLRGYIRSYARLVHIPEEELLPMMAKQVRSGRRKLPPMQSFSLGKRRKARRLANELYLAGAVRGDWPQRRLVVAGPQSAAGRDLHNGRSILRRTECGR